MNTEEKTIPWQTNEYIHVIGKAGQGNGKYGYRARNGVVKEVWLHGGKTISYVDFLRAAKKSGYMVVPPKQVR